MPRGRVGRNDRNEQRAVADLAPDLLIPHVPAAKLALVEEDFNAGRTQCLANLLRRLRILGGVAQKYRVRGLTHRQDHPWGGLLIASVGGSFSESRPTAPGRDLPDVAGPRIVALKGGFQARESVADRPPPAIHGIRM